MNKKKTVILALAGLLSAGAFSGVMMNEMGGIANVFANDNADAVTWKHYAAVAPTFTSHGSKEFWANCSNLGVHQFEAPAKGTIEEGGDFSLTTYFKELTAEDDRYVAKLTPKVTFDSRGGTVIESQDVEYNALATEPAAPTREADGYYDSYTFDGWYMNGEKFDFTKPVTGNVDLIAKWKYGNKKTVYVVSNWRGSDFSSSIEGKAVPLVRDNFLGNIFYSKGTDGINKAKATFKKTNDDGMGFRIYNEPSAKAIAPSMNFGELLKNYNKIFMEVGVGQTNMSLLTDAGGGTGTAIATNSNAEEATIDNCDRLTSTILTFWKDANGKVHMSFDDTMVDQPFQNVYVSRSGDIILTDGQANGTDRLSFWQNQRGSRYFWLGRPYAFEGEKTVLDVSQKIGLVATEGTLLTRDETNDTEHKKKAPFGQWYSPALIGYDAVGVFGTSSSSTLLTFNPMDFSSLFAKNQGVRFTLGAWNGLDTLYFKKGDKNVDLGQNQEKPNTDSLPYHDPSVDDRELIRNTWRNWEVSIEPTGISIQNWNTNVEYLFSMTEGQQKGTESLVFGLSKRSDQHFFIVSSWSTYHL